MEAGRDSRGGVFLGQIQLLIIQPTPFCNLDCDYCYLPGRQDKRRMPSDILSKVFEQVFACSFLGGGFTILWHAGEPLVMPVSFYQEAIDLVSKFNSQGIKVDHSIQTNATLITDAWCEFIKTHGLRMGVSVDGPQFLHDRHRKTRSGKGTLDKVLRGIELLHRHNIKFSVISVLTSDALDYPDEIYDFFMEAGIRRIGFNVEEIEGPHRSSSLDSGEMQERFAAFLNRFYDLVSRSPERFEIREFDSAIDALKAGCQPNLDLHAQQVTAGCIVSVAANGDFSTYSPELLGLESPKYGSFVYGNVMRDSLDAMFSHTAFQAVARDVESGVRKCRETCEYFPYCGGGAPVNKYFENGAFDTTETMFCRLSKKVVLDSVLEKLQSKSRRMESVGA